ncbi:MAG: ribonuclease HII [Verrucomicrobiota bacterium]
MSNLTWHWEAQAAKSGHHCVVGVDEAGRGPLAGPVVAAAYHFTEQGRSYPIQILDDSKKLSAKKRVQLFDQLRDHEIGRYSVAIIDPARIDEINILEATMEAMSQAVAGLLPEPDFVFIDGNRCPNLEVRSQAIVKGDGCCPSIAAASILAKVTRDRIMEKADQEYAGYEFKRHKGYGTKVHLEALKRLGPSPIHRQSFAPVRQAGLGCK